MQTELTKKVISQIGESIDHELGAQMISDYQQANPTDAKSYVIGRNIIDKILSHPGCVGMQLYNSYNEEGMKTLVYVGLDEFGNPLIQYTSVTNQGEFEKNKAIVGDRGPQGPSRPNDSEWWEQIMNAVK